MIALYLRSRPRFVVLLLLLLSTLGAAGLLTLPRLEDPTLSGRFALLRTVVLGADASRVETDVTDILEEELQDVEQLRLIRSQSRAGISVVSLELKDHVTDLEAAWADVRDRVNVAESRLSIDAQKPELLRPDVRAYALIVALKWSGDETPNMVLLQRQAERLEAHLRQVPGTESITRVGDNPEEISILIDRDKLDSRELSLSALAEQFSQREARVNSGQYINGSHQHVLRPDTHFQTLDEIRKAPLIRTPGGHFVALESLAQVKRGLKEPREELALVSGKPAVVVAVYAEDRMRVDRWTKEARKALTNFDLPEGLEWQILFEQNETVNKRLDALLVNLGLAILGVTIVMILVMGWRAALVVASSIPLTMASVLGGMVLLAIPIHQMSVTGLIVALGLLIDNAIVITDEMKMERDYGYSAEESIRKVLSRLTLPLCSSTATTVLAFLPIALLPGGVGEFVGPIALTVIIALLSSLLLSLTVLPILFLWAASDPGSSENLWNDGRLMALYQRLFTRPWTTAALALLLPILGFLSMAGLQEQFFPPTDRSQIRMIIELSNSRTLNSTEKAAQQIRDACLAYPEIEDIHWFIGRSVPKFYYNLRENRERQAQFAEALIQLKSSTETTDLIQRLQAELSTRFPEYRPRVVQLEQGPPFEAPIEFHLYGTGLDSMREAGNILRRALSLEANVIATRASLSEDIASLDLEIDLTQAKRNGIEAEDVARFLNLASLGRQVGTVFEDTENLPVVLRLQDRDRADLERLNALNVQTPRGPVPLSSLVRFKVVPEHAALLHRDRRRCNTVQAFLKAGTLPSTVLNPVLEKLDSGSLRLPAEVNYEVGGEAGERNRAVDNLLVYVLPLAVLMLASLVVAFRSFRMAFLVGTVGLLSAGTGFGALALLSIPFGFNAIIGTMGLLGVAVNDSTVVLTALQEGAPEGGVAPVSQTVAKASRHVVATTLTTIAGFLPLLLGDDRFWHPLAAVVSGGVAGATLLALLFCPAMYLLMRSK